MGNCFGFMRNFPKNSLDTLLLENSLNDTHQYASLMEKSELQSNEIDQQTVNFYLLERVKNLEENVKELSNDIHLLHQTYISNHQSSSK